jgi:hypothetical protein
MQLLTNRDETQKHGQALQAARSEEGAPRGNLQAFQGFLHLGDQMVKGLEANSSTCGVPPEMIKQVKTQHIKAEQMAKQVCDLAAWGTPGSIYPQAPIYAPVAQCTEKTLMPGVPCVD